MAAPMDNVIVGENENIDMCEIEATVATGFEQTAREEVEEKFEITAKAARGKVIARIPVKDVKKVLDLGCVDHIRVVMTSWKDVQFSKDELECMGKLRQLVKDVDWDAGLRVWKQVYTFTHPISSAPVSDTVDLGEPFLQPKANLPKKQPKDKKGKSGKKDKFGKKGKKDKAKDEAKPESGEPGRPPDLEFVGNEGQYVDGYPEFFRQAQCDYGNRQFEEGQFDDVESDTDNKLEKKQKEDLKEPNIGTESNLSAATADLSLNEAESPNQNATDSEKLDNSALTEPETLGKTNTGIEGKEESNKTDKLEAGSSVDPSSQPSSPQKPCSMSASPEKAASDTSSPQKPREKLVPHNPLMPAFRVTCNRAGEGHRFDSQSAAANFGGAVQQYFGWNVDMKNFDIEVILNIEWTDVSACIGLTKESLHHRNIAVFGATTLRPTIAHNMLRLCKIQPGEVVCDPMCGSGSIPIQAARCWPEAFHLAGEKYTKAVDRTMENVVALNKVLVEDKKPSIVVDAAYWDVNYLPFREGSIDVFITDLPFGKRMGSRFSNQKLYPDALMEMARICRPGSGRVCLLTQDKKCIIRAIQSLSRYWQRRLSLSINLGGLAAGVYLLNRTQVPVAKRGLPAQEDQPRDSGCRDFRTAMPSDPRSGPGFSVVRHTFNTSVKPEGDSTPPEKNEAAPNSEVPSGTYSAPGEIAGSETATSDKRSNEAETSEMPGNISTTS